MQVMVTLVRCGLTLGDSGGRQLGMMDEALCEEGRDELQRRVDDGVYPEVELVYSSPLVRCRGTAALIYPYILAVIAKEFRAFDLGKFQGGTYAELMKRADFLAWVESEGLDTCPGGENPYTFSARCIRGFRDTMEELSSKGLAAAAVVTHDAVIGVIMQRFCLPRSSYSNWSAPPGGGYTICYDTVCTTAKLTEII